MTDPDTTLRSMAEMLRQSRWRILRARVVCRLQRAAGVCAIGWCVLTAVALVLRLVSGSLHIHCYPGVGFVVLLAMSLSAIVLAYAAVMGTVGHRVTTTATAERLDLAQVTHNRIATAIALLRARDDSPLAKAAIREGKEALERLSGEQPYTEPGAFGWRRVAVCLLIGLVLLGGGQFIEVAPSVVGSRPPEKQDVIRDSRPSVPERNATAGDTAQKPHEVPGERPAAERVPPARPQNTDKKNTGQQTPPGPRSESAGPMAEHAAGTARKSRAASSSSSSAGSAGTKADPGDSDPGKPRKPKPVTKKPKHKEDVKQENRKSGSIDAGGASGAGSMRTAQNEWSNKVKGKADDKDDDAEEQEPDEEADENKQRIGQQPALKNRASRISRELSLMMGKDPNDKSKRGRGGPGGHKKSRGTATMIMGVPIPGFVKGRLLPGPTKSTQEETIPSPREANYAAVVSLPSVVAEEFAVERYRPSASEAARVRSYLVAVHGDGEDDGSVKSPMEDQSGL